MFRVIVGIAVALAGAAFGVLTWETEMSQVMRTIGTVLPVTGGVVLASAGLRKSRAGSIQN